MLAEGVFIFWFSAFQSDHCCEIVERLAVFHPATLPWGGTCTHCPLKEPFFITHDDELRDVYNEERLTLHKTIFRNRRRLGLSGPIPLGKILVTDAIRQSKRMEVKRKWQKEYDAKKRQTARQDIESHAALKEKNKLKMRRHRLRKADVEAPLQ